MSAVLTTNFAAQVREMTPQVHSILAEYSALVAGLDDSGEWQGAGVRDCAEWLVVHAGFGRFMGESLVVAGHAMRELSEVGMA